MDNIADKIEYVLSKKSDADIVDLLMAASINITTCTTMLKTSIELNDHKNIDIYKQHMIECIGTYDLCMDLYINRFGNDILAKSTVCYDKMLDDMSK